MPRIAATIVAWNSMRYLPEALAALAGQTFRDLSVIVVDNGSTDGAAEFVRTNYPDALVLRNSKNLGPARARNQAIAYAAAQLRRDGDVFVLTLDPDVVLAPDFIETLVSQLERRPEVGSAGGKTYRMHRTGEDTLATGDRTDVIDSAGLGMARSRRARELGVGERDDGGRRNRTQEVFGFSVALALYRLQALESAAFGTEVFDEDFFAFEEDVDLAWRLRLAGWQALYVPTAKAYRYRAAPHDGSWFAGLMARWRGSPGSEFLTYRNRLLTRLKNDRLFDALLALPWIAAEDLRACLAALLFAPRSLRALPSALRLLPKMLKKRRATLKAARVKGPNMRKWFTSVW